MVCQLSSNNRWQRFTKALLREWKVPVSGAITYMCTKLLSYSDESAWQWFGTFSGYLVLLAIAIHIVAVFCYPDNNDEIMQQDKVELGAFINKHFHKCWLAVAIFSGFASLGTLTLAIVKLFEEPSRLIASTPYLCVSVFLFGVFYSLKGAPFSKTTMSIGIIGTIVTSAALFLTD